jgi:hypothetical protein
LRDRRVIRGTQTEDADHGTESAGPPFQSHIATNPAICGAFQRAAEGTRTLDLLHGKSRQRLIDHDLIMISRDDLGVFTIQPYGVMVG